MVYKIATICNWMSLIIIAIEMFQPLLDSSYWYMHCWCKHCKGVRNMSVSIFSRKWVAGTQLTLKIHFGMCIDNDIVALWSLIRMGIRPIKVYTHFDWCFKLIYTLWANDQVHWTMTITENYVCRKYWVVFIELGWHEFNTNHLFIWSAASSIKLCSIILRRIFLKLCITHCQL